MSKKIDYNEILARIGFFRNQAHLSARETSLRLGFSEQFMKRIENGSVELKVRTLLDFCELANISLQDFFYLGKEYNAESKQVLELFSNLSAENQNVILDLMKKLR